MCLKDSMKAYMYIKTRKQRETRRVHSICYLCFY